MESNSSSKISPALAKKLETTRLDELVEVVVHLNPPQVPQEGTRTERIEITKRAFARDIDQLAAGVARGGGEVLETAWINSTARCLATPEQIEQLQLEDVVQGIDSLWRIDPDK
jgi:hypothetical protein